VSSIPGAPTLERRRRSTFEAINAPATEYVHASAGLRVYRAVSILERLSRNGTLEVRQTQAGERFRADYELGVVGTRESRSGSHATTGWGYPDARLDALRRYRNARRSLLRSIRPIVFACIVCDHSISDVAKVRKQNRQEIAGILKIGLTALADHYGIDG
jgi:hypothetical protein